MNEHFVKTGQNLAMGTGFSYLRLLTDCSGANEVFAIKPPTGDEIYEITQGLCNSYTVGHDNVPGKIVKQNCGIFFNLLEHLIKNCLVQITYPKIFEKSVITPSHKGGICV